MRVLMITDRMFAARERTMLRRLQVGLAAEGVQVVQAVPRGMEEPPIAITKTDTIDAPVISYLPTRVPLAAKLVARRMLGDARKLLGLEDDEPVFDVVHVYGGASWTLGLAIADLENAAVALEIWRHGLVASAKALRQGGGRRILLIAPDPALQRSLAIDAVPIHSVLAPWCVHTPSAFRPPLSTGRSPSAMLVGSGNDAGAYAAAVEGLASLIKALPETLLFADADAAHRTRLMRQAQRLGILNRLTLIDALESRGDLITAGDLLVQPEARGEQKSILLEAMASGMIVVAAADRMVSILQDGVTARLVVGPSAQHWSRVLGEILAQRSSIESLSESARAFTRDQRPASLQVQCVLNAYRTLTAVTSVATRTSSTG